MKKTEASETRQKKSSGLSVWHVIGGAAVVAVAAGVYASLNDIRRYLKIRAM